MSDLENVLDALNGDKQAYGRLVDSYQGVVFAVALNITGNYSDSQDVVQEVFITAYRKLRTLSKPANFNKWLYTIAKRVSYSFIRKKKRSPNSTVDQIDIAKMKADALTAAEEYAHKEFNALVWKQVHNLPRKSREAILLYYMEGFSIKKAAAFLSITESAMQSRLKIARQRIRQNLDEKLEHELKHHRPSQKTKNYILAALPAGGVPKITPLSSLATKGTLTMAAITAKKAAIIVAAIIIATVTIINRPPKPTPIVPPVVENEKEVTAKNDLRIPQETMLPDMSDTAAIVENSSSDTETQVESTISGYVYYTDSQQPVPGAYVIMNKGGFEHKTVITNKQGHYQAQFPAGLSIALMYARKNDYASNIITSLLIEKDKSLNDVDFFLEPGAEIHGILKNKQTKKPVPGRNIHLSKHINPYSQHGPIAGSLYVPCDAALNNDNDFSSITDTQGAFAFSGLPPGEYSLSTPGAHKNNTTISLKLGGKRTGIDLEIEIGGATIYVTVIDEDGTPLRAFTRMELYDTDKETSVDVGLESQSETGYYVYEDCLTGQQYTYRLLTQVLLEKITFAKNEEFTLKNDEQNHMIDVVVPAASSGGAVIQGKVTDESLAPFSRTMITIQFPDNKCMLITSSDEYGDYKVSGIKPGDYTITFIALAENGVGYSTTGHNQVSKEFSIDAGDCTKTIDAVLPLESPDGIPIKLVYQDGSPLSNQSIQTKGGRKTDEKGIIKNAFYKPDEPVLYIAVAGITYCFKPLVEEHQKQITLIIAKPGSISGRVTHSQYEYPVKQFSLKATLDGIAYSSKTITSKTGEFYLDALQPGEYTLNISAEIDSKTLSGTITNIIVEADAATEDLRIFLSE